MKRPTLTRILCITFVSLFLLSSLFMLSACTLNIGGSLSAYEIAVKNGFEGTEEEWLASLKGEDGKDAENTNTAPTVGDNISYINQALMASVSIYCQYEKSNGSSGYSAGSGVVMPL